MRSEWSAPPTTHPFAFSPPSAAPAVRTASSWLDHRLPRRLAAPLQPSPDRSAPVLRWPRCTRPISASRHFFHEHRRLAGSRTAHPLLAQRRPAEPVAFHDVTSASAGLHVDRGGVVDPLVRMHRFPGDRASGTPVASPRPSALSHAGRKTRPRPLPPRPRERPWLARSGVPSIGRGGALIAPRASLPRRRSWLSPREVSRLCRRDPRFIASSPACLPTIVASRRPPPSARCSPDAVLTCPSRGGVREGAWARPPATLAREERARIEVRATPNDFCNQPPETSSGAPSPRRASGDERHVGTTLERSNLARGAGPRLPQGPGYPEGRWRAR